MRVWYFRRGNRLGVALKLPDTVPSYGSDWRDFIRPKPVFDNTKLGRRLRQVKLTSEETLGLDEELAGEAE